MKKIKQKKTSSNSQSHNKSSIRLPFVEHLFNLRHRSGYSNKVMELLKQDAEARAVRLATAAGLKPFGGSDARLAPAMATSPIASPDQSTSFDKAATFPSMQRNFYRQVPTRIYNRGPLVQ